MLRCCVVKHLRWCFKPPVGETRTNQGIYDGGNHKWASAHLSQTHTVYRTARDTWSSVLLSCFALPVLRRFVVQGAEDCGYLLVPTGIEGVGMGSRLAVEELSQMWIISKWQYHEGIILIKFKIFKVPNTLSVKQYYIEDAWVNTSAHKNSFKYSLVVVVIFPHFHIFKII